MLDTILVPLKAAELASSTVALLASVQDDFPELRPTMGLGLYFLRLSWEELQPVAPVVVPAPPAVPQEPKEETSSDWDPSSPRDVSRCKALLLEILRRAAHDWVLYRQHHKLLLRELAEDAYTWLFLEEPGHAYHRHRMSHVFELEDGSHQGVRAITSFLAICDALSLDPDTVRAHVRKLDVKTIIASGRPAETRKPLPVDAVAVDECNLTVAVDINAMPYNKEFVSEYESLGTISTPSSLSHTDYSDLY